jgi:hypothetical protein
MGSTPQARPAALNPLASASDYSKGSPGMVSVFIRFLSALLGALAAFFIASHVLHTAGYISPYTLERVNELFRLLIRPVTTLEATTGKTALIVAAAILIQGLAFLLLFRRWDRPANKIVPVEQSSQEIPHRLRSIHGLGDDYHDDEDHDDIACESAHHAPAHAAGHDCGPSSRAIEMAKRLAQHRA